MSAVSSDSSRANASLSSSTLRSFAAIAVMNSFTLEGDGRAEWSCGVGGTEDGVDAVAAGVGLEGSLVGRAIGRVSDSLFGMRLVDSVRECRLGEDGAAMLPTGSGGGGMLLLSRLRCLLALLVRGGPGVVEARAFAAVRGDDDDAGSGAEAKVEVVAAPMVLLRTEASIGVRSAADERRRISECEAMARCLLEILEMLCNE